MMDRDAATPAFSPVPVHAPDRSPNYAVLLRVMAPYHFIYNLIRTPVSEADAAGATLQWKVDRNFFEILMILFEA